MRKVIDGSYSIVQLLISIYFLQAEGVFEQIDWSEYQCVLRKYKKEIHSKVGTFVFRITN